MFSLEQLRDPPTEEEALDELKQLLTDAGLITTDWVPGTVELTLLRLSAFLYNKSGENASTLSKIFFNDDAEGDALTALSDSHFDNQRSEAVKTQGRMILSLSVGNGPYNFGIGEVNVVADDQFEYTNVTGGTLSGPSYFLTMSFEAADYGSAYNIANDSSALRTTYNGVSVFNPAQERSDTWVSRLGVDEEPDDVLRLRNSTKWSTLATGEMVNDRVRSIALNASPDVHDVYVDDQNPRGAGTVDVYCAGDLFTAPGGSVAEVQHKLTGSFFGDSSRIQAFPAPEVEFARTITVYYRPSGVLEEVTTSVEEALDSWITDVPIGGLDFSPGPNHVASIGDLLALLEGIETVRKAVIQDAGTDITLAVNQKLTKPNLGWPLLVTYVRTTS